MGKNTQFRDYDETFKDWIVNVYGIRIGE